MEVAVTGIDELGKHVDSLITIPNEKLLTVLPKGTSLAQAFAAVNDVLHGAVRGIADLITQTGEMNVDFADVRTVMREMGLAMMGTGRASGPERARQAAELAISSPLLDDINVTGAKGLLVNVTAANGFGMDEMQQLNDLFEAIADADATVKIGMAYDETLGEEVRITVIATGLGRPAARSRNDIGGPVMVGPGSIWKPAPSVVVAAAEVQTVIAPAAAMPAPVAPVVVAAAAAAPIAAPVAAPQPMARPGLRVANGGVIDYATFDTPTVTRQGGSTQQGDQQLNIPAFLRRQAD
jgi:cell division protein FtsZ